MTGAVATGEGMVGDRNNFFVTVEITFFLDRRKDDFWRGDKLVREVTDSWNDTDLENKVSFRERK